MSNGMTSYNIAQLINKIDSKGFADKEDLSYFISSQRQETDLPFYLKIIMGIGALFTLLFFMLFLIVSGAFDYLRIAVLGLMLIASAIGLEKLAHLNNIISHTFLTQISLVCMIAGKLCLVFEFNGFLDSSWNVALGLFFVTVVTYPIYRLWIDRFVFSFALLLSILVTILFNWDNDGVYTLLFNGFFLLQVAILALLLTNKRFGYNYDPLFYAIIFSLCMTVIFLAFSGQIYVSDFIQFIHPIFVNITLTLGLICLFVWISGGVKQVKTERFLLASVGTILLGIISAPGILLTIGLIVLGYAKYNRALTAVGSTLMPMFLFLYYYNLDISLLQKSGVLISSGILLLAGRFYFNYKGWDKEAIPCE